MSDSRMITANDRDEPIFYYEELMRNRDRTMRVYGKQPTSPTNSHSTVAGSTGTGNEKAWTMQDYVQNVYLISPMQDEGLAFTCAIDWIPASSSLVGAVQSGIYNAYMNTKALIETIQRSGKAGDKAIDAMEGQLADMGITGGLLTDASKGVSLYNPADYNLAFNGSSIALNSLSVLCTAVSGFNVPFFIDWTGKTPVNDWLTQKIITEFMSQYTHNSEYSIKLGDKTYEVGAERPPHGYTLTNQDVFSTTTTKTGTWTLAFGQNRFFNDLLCDNLSVNCSKHLTMSGDFYLAQVGASFKFASKLTTTDVRNAINGKKWGGQ